MSPPIARAALVAAALVAGCGAEDPARVAGRLWVTKIPASPRQPFTAFATVRQAGGAFVGASHRGSLYEGRYRTFRWRPLGPRRAQLTTLQTKAASEVRWRPCTPPARFDACIELTAGPLPHGRYLSRASWTTGGRDAPAPAVADILGPALARARAAGARPQGG